MVYISTLPPAGELRTTGPSTSPFAVERPREVVGAAESDAGRLEPVLRECALELAGHRALHPHVGIAPLAFLLAVAAPLAAVPEPPVTPTRPSTTRMRR